MSNETEHDKEVGNTGHEWDGIKELNNPLPRWWLWCFYLTIIWGSGYTIAYPAWPMINKATAGVLGYSTRAEVAAEIVAAEQANSAINATLVAAELTEVSADAVLMQYANSAGASGIRTWCAQCLGSGGAGVQASGYPNLLDDDWLWGGDIENIHLTIAHGIRNEEDLDSRYSQMPAYGEIFEEQEILSVVQYVKSLSGTPDDATLAAAGEELFLDNCAACHGDEGLGDVEQGAPNLADAIWLYGGDTETLIETVTYSRFGVMPPWQGRLSEAEVRAVALYVHSRGGGQ